MEIEKMEIEKISEIVISNVSSLVETLPDDQKFIVDINTKLFGKDANIDSLSLVSIIVDLETIFSDDYNIEISLTDDRAMMRKISPFESISTLVNYIDELINEQ
jgi:acyl carrier protein